MDDLEKNARKKMNLTVSLDNLN